MDNKFLPVILLALGICLVIMGWTASYKNVWTWIQSNMGQIGGGGNTGGTIQSLTAGTPPTTGTPGRVRPTTLDLGGLNNYGQ